MTRNDDGFVQDIIHYLLKLVMKQQLVNNRRNVKFYSIFTCY